MNMETLSLFDLPSPLARAQETQVQEIPFQQCDLGFDSDFPQSAGKSPLRDREALPDEHTLSVDDKWAYPGGNFGCRLSQNLLEDPRIRDLSLKSLGLYVTLRASWEAGRPIPAKSKLAAKNFGITPAAWTNCIDELSMCQPAMIEIRQGYVLPTSFGKPIRKGLSEVRALAAHARHEKVKSQDGQSRPPEIGPAPDDEVIPDSIPGELAFDLLGDQIQPDSSPQIPCPFGEIMSLFVKQCPSLPHPMDVKGWPGTRKRRVGEIWKKNPTLDFWRALFETVEASDFLCGRGGKPWKASFDWIIDQKNLLKIREGNFSSNGRPNMFQGGRFNVGSYGNHDIDTTADWLKPDDGTQPT